MNPQDLKKGQSYLILANFEEKDFYNEYDFVAAPSDYRLVLDEASVRQCVFLPSEPPTLVGSQPKHDPCRKFRKGDIAEVSQYKGRAIIPIDLKVGDKVKVCENEKEGASFVQVIDHIGRRFFIIPAFLELSTPIEELEPYGISENLYGWIVFKDSPGNVMANFNKTHPNPKEAAEAECDRLNAEHRKEQSHD